MTKIYRIILIHSFPQDHVHYCRVRFTNRLGPDSADRQLDNR